KERDWFTQHFYFCLPITFANQHGFIVRSLYDVIARWNGGIEVADLSVHCIGSESAKELQLISSHFGSGILTIQNRWTYRTPKGVNFFVTQPPNLPIENVMHMAGIVESDQLRRDFTFNLKITTRDRDVFIPRGTPIGCILPYPRGFIDGYSIAIHPEG